MSSESPSLSMDIVADNAVLKGALDCPGSAIGLVIFVHGNGNSRSNLRNQYVADQLHAAGLGMLLFDLLSTEEASHAPCRFDVTFLARHLQEATRTAGNVAREHSLRFGYFDVGTGAVTATLAASELDDACMIEAATSRDGRPGLAGQRTLARLAYPTSLIVGAADSDVLGLSRQALNQVRHGEALETTPRATHLFGEVGAFEQVAELARTWFARHLSTAT